MPALPEDVESSLGEALLVLPPPTVQPLAIETKVGWRTNLVLRLSSPNIDELLRSSFTDAGRFSRLFSQPVSQKATLCYGISDDAFDSLPALKLEAAVEEMQRIPWEFCLVARRDHGTKEEGGLPRELIFSSAEMGERSYAIALTCSIS